MTKKEAIEVLKEFHLWSGALTRPLTLDNASIRLAVQKAIQELEKEWLSELEFIEIVNKRSVSVTWWSNNSIIANELDVRGLHQDLKQLRKESE